MDSREGYQELKIAERRHKFKDDLSMVKYDKDKQLNILVQDEDVNVNGDLSAQSSHALCEYIEMVSHEKINVWLSV